MHANSREMVALSGISVVFCTPNPQAFMSGHTVISNAPPVAAYTSCPFRTTFPRCVSGFIPTSELLNALTREYGLYSDNELSKLFKMLSACDWVKMLSIDKYLI